jgi:hypothetical protein
VTWTSIRDRGEEEAGEASDGEQADEAERVEHRRLERDLAAVEGGRPVENLDRRRDGRLDECRVVGDRFEEKEEPSRDEHDEHEEAGHHPGDKAGGDRGPFALVAFHAHGRIPSAVARRLSRRSKRGASPAEIPARR